MEVVKPIWEVQVEIARKVLELNRRLTAFESALWDISPTPEGVQMLREFVALLMELRIIFYPELKADEEYSKLLNAFDLYATDKDAFARRYPALIYAVYAKGSVRTPVAVFHNSLDEIPKYLERNRDLQLTKVEIFPSLDLMQAMARAIVSLGLQMDILRLTRNPAPVIKFAGGVDDYRAEAERAVEGLRKF